MRLERLEIAGFKSFSDRSELAFDQGVTAIVGPNGCGKSNVADAITWVLGEQSARSLRGEKMEDVIFSGSDARKPTATAEVRLRLSGVTSLPTADGNGNGNGHAHGNGNRNGHGNGHADVVEGQAGGPVEALPLVEEPVEHFRPVGRDVELIRRLYRSGESEYLIDGEQCRLKDIHELLMDTGLGAKAYAIIEQGKIGMILSSRPTDRRQLIEEAAGITKYKARRRSAELKLEAAQQNLTRIDDIIFEVDKQRGSLKRQAAKARRHQRLREELRRWEKLLFAEKYRGLAAAIESARQRLTEAREREAGAAARLAEVESALGALRIEAAETDSRATAARERAHAHELDIRRTEQQVELNRQQIAALGSRIVDVDRELESLAARREPQRAELEARRTAATEAEGGREQAASRLRGEQDAYQAASVEIESLETDVEAARREVFTAMSQATTLAHAIDNATAARERAQETLGRLDVEESDVRIETDRTTRERLAADEQLTGHRASLERARQARVALEQELATGRATHASLSQALRDREHDVARLSARLASLEELDLARAGFTEAARAVLADASHAVESQGAVADFIEVDRGYERAVEALTGELLQHVIVPSHAHAARGLEVLRAQGAGRCGFVVSGDSTQARVPTSDLPGLRALDTVVRAAGPFAAAISAVLPHAYIADSFDAAVAAARDTGATIATRDGDLVSGGHIVVGGERRDARGILDTKAEVKELRARVEHERAQVAVLAEQLAAAAAAVAAATDAIAACAAEGHELEKSIVGVEAQVSRATDDAERLQKKNELLTAERRRAAEEIARLDERQAEARESTAALDVRRHEAEERFAAAQRRLLEARERVEGLSQQVAEARASYAALVERAAALGSEVARLEEASRDLEERLEARATEKQQKTAERAALDVATSEALTRLDAAVASLDGLRQDVRDAEEAVAALRSRVDAEEARVKEARGALDGARSGATELEVARATAESDLSHLAATCVDAVQAPLEEVLAEVERLDREGAAPPDSSTIAAASASDEEEGEDRVSQVDQVSQVDGVGQVGPVSTEDAIHTLKAKIDRLGPVNMMAIEQFDELETRHHFLTTQRADLVQSIAATNEAITRIDETSKARFKEAFDTINVNFQRTFSTLFGGGRAGITLLDETDPLESGIDIVASPPGKRLQSVQLLSGGEKALTAIALMFSIFQYKPSPFCLLDEIDAPLDDANIGRFVEMLKAMLHHTQFILITHNRKTMEIADRLYGVTMEEPGVSRLISVRLN
jgi:chromosome segregation protein